MSLQTRRDWFPFLAAALVTALSYAIASTAIGGRLELLIRDLALAAVAPPPPEELVIVEIDDGSLAQVGSWPWPRSVHADLIRRLTSAGPRVIGLAVHFGTPSVIDPDSDIALADAIGAAGNVVLPVLLDAPRRSAPLLERLPMPALIERAAALGHVDIPIDSDGAARSLYLRAGIGAPVWDSFVRATLHVAAGLDPATPQPLAVRTQEPLSRNWIREDFVLLPMPLAEPRIRRLSAGDLLGDGADLSALGDALVLIGVTARGISNEIAIPTVAGVRRISAIEFHAQTLASLATDAVVRLPPQQRGEAVLVLVAVACALIMLVSGGQTLAALAALAAISGGCMAILVYGGYWLSPLIPLIATSLAYSLRRLLDLRLVRARLQEIELRNQLMLDAIGDAVIAVDRAERVVFLNPAAAELLGTSRERALGAPFATLAPLTDLRQGDEVGVARGRRIAELRRPDGTRRDVGVQTRPLRIGGVRGRLHVLTDVTEQRRMTRELAYLATHDPLTGLVNRALLNDRLCQAIARAGRSSLSLAVLLIDLDRFKNVNDGLGHAAGDQLLVALTERLRALLRSVDTVARIGGDEFAVLLQDLARPGDAVTVAEKILSCLTEPFQLAGYEVNVSASIGISIYPGDGASPDELLRNADAAMYGAKRKGRNCSNLFSSEMYAEALGRLELEGQLRTALQRAEFVLHYQPTIDLASNRVTGVEALIRWDSPQRGRVSPATFIPLAEETGLILPIGEWVLSHACRQCLDWQTRGLPQMHIGVNISARQFFHGDLLGLVTRVLEETGLAADRLMLEITETMLMEDVDGAGQTLRALKTRGVQLALDDFGTGYSSLNYLKRLPLDFLKVDRSFVANIGHKQEDEAIVRAVVALATSLGLRVIAEGVEEQDQLSFLREVDCHAAQGFLFSRPLPASELAPRLAA